MATSKPAIPEIPRISLVTSTPEDVLRALSTVGFIHLDLQGTGLTRQDVDRAFELSAMLHSVPREDRVGFMKDSRGNGYFDMKGSLDERVDKDDWREDYVWGRFKPSAGETETTQVLPKALQQYRHEFVEFDNKCFEASLRILDMLSQALDLPTDFLRSTHKDASSNQMGFLNYPTPNKMPAEDDIRAGSHKDWGDITLLFQEKNGQPGLQIYLPPDTVKEQKGMQLVQGDVDLESGVWVSAPIIPDTVLVNVGLTLEGMTDGLCKATVHRVIFPPANAGELPKNRKSIAYFSTPSFDILINPIKPGGIVMKTEGALTVGEFFRERERLAGLA